MGLDSRGIHQIEQTETCLAWNTNEGKLGHWSRDRKATPDIWRLPCRRGANYAPRVFQGPGCQWQDKLGRAVQRLRTQALKSFLCHRYSLSFPIWWKSQHPAHGAVVSINQIMNRKGLSQGMTPLSPPHNVLCHPCHLEEVSSLSWKVFKLQLMITEPWGCVGKEILPLDKGSD